MKNIQALYNDANKIVEQPVQEKQQNLATFMMVIEYTLVMEDELVKQNLEPSWSPVTKKTARGDSKRYQQHEKTTGMEDGA